MFKTVAELTTTDLQSVYSGRDGHCCCGCSGKHYNNPAWHPMNDRNHMRTSTRMHNKVLGILQSHPDTEVCNDPAFSSHVSVVVEGRLYIAYLQDGVFAKLDEAVPTLRGVGF